MSRDRTDLFDRLHLGDDWPDGSPSFDDGFARGVADPTTGRIGYDVPRPAVAARPDPDRGRCRSRCATASRRSPSPPGSDGHSPPGPDGLRGRVGRFPGDRRGSTLPHGPLRLPHARGGLRPVRRGAGRDEPDRALPGRHRSCSSIIVSAEAGDAGAADPGTTTPERVDQHLSQACSETMHRWSVLAGLAALLCVAVGSVGPADPTARLRGGRAQPRLRAASSVASWALKTVTSADVRRPARGAAPGCARRCRSSTAISRWKARSPGGVVTGVGQVAGVEVGVAGVEQPAARRAAGRRRRSGRGCGRAAGRAARRRRAR